MTIIPEGLPRCLSGKESACQWRRHRRLSLIPGLRRSPGEGNGYPLQYSCLGNPMNRGAWQATVHGVPKELDTTYQLNNKKFGSKLPFWGLSLIDTLLFFSVCPRSILHPALCHRRVISVVGNSSSWLQSLALWLLARVLIPPAYCIYLASSGWLVLQ